MALGRISSAALLLLSACSNPTSDATASEDGESANDEGTATGIPDAAQDCVHLECEGQCEAMLDPCGNPMTGNCLGPECHCDVFPACPPCDPNRCGPFEECFAGYSSCQMWCTGTYVGVWEPRLDCRLTPGWPSVTNPTAYDGYDVRIGLTEIPHVDVCGGEIGWTWEVYGATLLLCDAACAEWEVQGSVEVDWETGGDCR